MSFVTRQQPVGRRLGMIALVIVLLALVPGCRTESARATATAVARGTPETTKTPAGNILMIDGDPVIQVFTPLPLQAALYALTGKRLYVWHNRAWEPTATRNDGRRILVDQNDIEHLFRGNHPPCDNTDETTAVNLEVSADGGATWSVLPHGENIRPLAIDPVFGEVLYGTDCSLTISSDLGKSWRYFEPLFQHEIVDLVVVGERVLVLGISDTGKSQVRELRLASPDDPEISDIIAQVNGIACVDADEDRIVIGGPFGVQLSRDGGQTWSINRIGLESVTLPEDSLVAPNNPSSQAEREFGVLTIAIDPSHSHRIFAGTVRGLYISQDDGGTWDLYSEVAVDTQVTAVQPAADGADLYVTTSEGVVVVPNP